MAGLKRRFALAAVALPLLMLAMSGMARASILLVTSTNDAGAGSLRNQIAAASAGDTIEFSVTGTISLLSGLSINKDLTITGPTGSPGITLDGGGSVQVMSVGMGIILNLQNLTIAHGVSNFGGGIFNDATLTITNSTFSGNGSGDGGGIYNNGTLTVTNSTFSGNSTGNFGGGILNSALGSAAVTNCTFSDNNGPASAGGIANFGNATLKGTVLAAGTGGNCFDFLPLADAGYNISDDDSCGFTESPSGTSINNSTTLHLDPAGLANNGGPTKTIALEANSQAVDFIPVANCTDQSSPTPQLLTTDQRGLPRPDPGNPNFCDAGAFELQTTPFVLAPNSERLQIARSAVPDSDRINTAFTFIENGFPACDAADDAFNGFFLVLESGTCAVHDHASLLFFLQPWVVHTVNHQSYGTLFSSFPPGSLSARMVELPTPAAPACGEWSLNLEIAGIDSTPLGDGPFSLILSNTDGDTQCFDITNAIVGSQTPPPPHGVRRRGRR